MNMKQLLLNFRKVLSMIKFEHSIFVLPFAYLGAIVGSFDVLGKWPSWSTIGWITLAMISARSFGMAVNRVVDRNIDAKNPRTKTRELVQKTLSLNFVKFFIFVSLILLIVSAYNLNLFSFYCIPIALFFLIIYSYTKRFTWLCHLFLGVVTGLGPLGAWIGATGSFNNNSLWLFVAVVFWVSGFDILYALLDYDFDVKNKVYSLPSKFGKKTSLLVSSLLHFGTMISLYMFWFNTALSFYFALSLIIVGVILFYEHYIITPSDISRINTAFFTLNGFISLILFFLALVDLWQA